MDNGFAKTMIDWWCIDVGREEIDAVGSAIQNRHVSQGPLTEEFEAELADLLGVKHVVCTTSGTMALFMAYIASGLKADEVVAMPTRTWIATANPALALGAKLKLIDSEQKRQTIDLDLLDTSLSRSDRIVVAVHMNGTGVDMEKMNALGERFGLVGGRLRARVYVY